MKFGIFGINMDDAASPEAMLAVARKAEEVGMDSVWTAEHVIMPLDYRSRYPFGASGKIPVTPETNFADPLISLAHVAAATKTLKLATGINLLAQSNPLLLAKQVASLDFLSGGRLLLGLGVGWLAEEFQAMGTPFERRGERFDDYLAAMKKVWSGEVVEHRSEFLSWSGFKSYPLPARKPHPPIIIGGHSRAALRRVARSADGWFAFTQNPERLREYIGQLNGFAREAGRDPASIEITALWNFGGKGAAPIETYRELGISRLLVTLRGLGEENPLPAIERLGNEVIGKI